MNLSKLVYLCVKNAIYFDDASFSFDSFKKGMFDGDPEYALNINNVYLPLNEAIARLSDLERIPYKIVKVSNIQDNFVSLKTIEKDNDLNIKEVVNVFYLNTSSNNYEKVSHKYFWNKVLLLSNYDKNNLYLEVKEDIPHFDSTMYHYNEDSGSTIEEFDLDLKDYGINDSMCNYLMEYVMGKLTEQISPEIANMHISRAESYFNNLKANSDNFVQRQVKAVYKVGE